MTTRPPFWHTRHSPPLVVPRSEISDQIDRWLARHSQQTRESAVSVGRWLGPEADDDREVCGE